MTMMFSQFSVETSIRGVAVPSDGSHNDRADPTTRLAPLKAPGVRTSEPLTVAESDVTGPTQSHRFDDDLAWMFEGEAEAPTPRASDDIVGRALDDLLGDWARKGGQLTRAEVALIATRGELSPSQHGELIALLEEVGVDLPPASDVRPRRPAPKGYELGDDSVRQYLRTISRYPLINAAREVELWSLISQGVAARRELDSADGDDLGLNVRRSLQERVLAGRQAHAELVCANLRLVVSIAKARHYETSGVEFADRVQDGNLGLMRAADKFDGSKGFKFSTYATWWIKQSIERGISDRGRTIRIPVHVHEKVVKVKKARSRLFARLDREPTLAELSDLTGLEPGQVQFMLDTMRPLRSLDELLGDEGDLHLSDVLVHDEDRDGRTDPVQIVIHEQLHDDLIRTLATLLPERAAGVLRRRFGIGTGEQATLESIAAVYGLTRERIRQIQDKALSKLRESSDAEAMLRPYLIDNSRAYQSGSATPVVGRAS
jgi:RNA polymerase sigma factor (sigma-70 family)